MLDIEKMKDMARNVAASEIFSVMKSEENSQKLLERIRAQPDVMLDLGARLNGIPEDQFHIHRAIVRGEKNIFTDGLGAIDGLLQTGDIILMTGTSSTSQKLARVQKISYKNARSSHVAVVHADFICIDAMPKLGSSNRIISDVLTNVESDWRVIRMKNLDSKNKEMITRACVYYLAQPYKISPSKKPAKTFSYCSELARKIYTHAGIKNHEIPNNSIIKPADFDKLADKQSQWSDITEDVRPAINFYKTYPELLKATSKLFIDGLKLNKQRFKDRENQIKEIQLAAKTGKISREQMMKMIKEIKKIENNLNHTFWDVARQKSQ